MFSVHQKILLSSVVFNRNGMSQGHRQKKNTFANVRNLKMKTQNVFSQKGVYLRNLLLTRLLFNEVACIIKTILHTVQHYQVPYAPRFHSISWMRLQKVLCSAPNTELTVGLRAVPCANPAVDHSLQTPFSAASGFIVIYPASVWAADVAQTALSTCKCSSLSVLKAVSE